MLLKPVLPVVDYVVNYEYISTVLCENKAKPKMECNGKCHLKKVIKEQDNQNSSKKIVTDSEVIFLNATQNFNFSIVTALKKKTIFVKKDLFKSDTYYPIEHPPQNLI